MAFKRGLAYTGVAQPTPPNQVVLTRAPTSKDFNFNIGDRWVVPTSSIAPSEQEWVLMSKEQNVAVWVQVNAAGATTYNDHELLVGTGTPTINTINNSTAGLPLLTQGASADPTWGVLAVPAGGTAKTSFIAYTPICGGTTTTGALQSVASLGASGTVLTSNGAGLLPTFQAPGGGTLTVPGGGTGDTSILAYAVVTGGITDVDPLQTVGSLGTLNQVLTSQGAGTLPIWADNSPTDTGFTSIVIQTFTGSGTYTPTANMKYCIVEALGGGGSGGGTSGTGNLAAGGGGAAGYCKKVITAATIGASKAVVIGAGGVGVIGNTGGAGGDTTFGVILTAGKGNGGSPSTFTGTCGAGGAGGSATGGDINIAGQGGMPGVANNTAIGSSACYLGGAGGSTMYGGGGYGTGAGSFTAQASTGYGSGGAGIGSLGGSSAPGGAGASGLVIVTEYIGS